MGNRIHSLQADDFTGYPIVLSSDHSYIHKGLGFSLVGNSGSVAAAGTFVISFVTPSGKYVHLRPTSIGSTKSLGLFTIAEGSTMTGGTDATPLNRNRNSLNASLVTAKTGATISAEGSVKLVELFIGYPNTGSGGQNGENDEIVLKPGTAYSLKFSNIGETESTVFYFSMFWYEEQEG